MNYLYKTAFNETPEDNFIAEIMSVEYTVPKIWQIFIGKEEEVPCRENFPVILGK
jgi:hypothetical protein